MTTTPQAALLSDDEIERHFEINKSAPGRELRRLIGRSIEADVLAKQATQAEPFGYFRALPFGWEQCAEDDDGAVALYEHPAEPVQAGELPDERLSRVTKGTLSIARDAIEYEKGIAHKQGYKQGYQQGKEDERQRALAARKPLTPLTPAQMEKGRDQIFSINNPFCPCDSKTFRKVAEWVERHHGIGLEVKP